MKSISLDKMEALEGGETYCEIFDRLSTSPLWISGLGLGYLTWLSINCELCPTCGPNEQ